LGPFLLNNRLLIGAILTIVLALALHLFLTRTRQGLRLAAVAESHNTALSLGVSVRSAIAIAWILGTAVATLGAIVLLSGRILSLDVADIGFKALPVALLGGLESVRGAPLAGLLIGIGEQLAMSYLDPITNGVASNVLPFGVMIAVLLIRPQGLFGWKKIERL
jgi:branched-chain amino acid transport system permease protein